MTSTYLCAHCSTSNEAWQKAEELYKNGKYPLAAVGYEYLFFSTENADTSTYALIMKARCYKNTKQYIEALKNLGRVNNFNLNDSLSQCVYYETALCAYLEEDFNKATFTLEQALNSATATNDKAKLYFLKVLLSNSLFQYKTAKEYLLKYQELTNRKINIDSLYGESPNYKRPTLAGLMSVFVPGSGQLYTQHYKEAAVNLTMQLATLGLTAFTVYKGYYIIAFLSGTSLLQRFYMGGVYKSEDYAKELNKERAAKFNRKVLELMKN
ncbi:MAG: hypothetical protein NTX03_02895 [Bacteroidetes bacterium]|nr:hypothetical protein [Bacteroidota bacterium]